jgi:hypothetical protein
LGLRGLFEGRVQSRPEANFAHAQVRDACVALRSRGRGGAVVHSRWGGARCKVVPLLS